MKNIIIFLLTFQTLDLIGQLNLPIKFQNDVVSWDNLAWIEDNKKEDQVFENRLPPIIIEDTIYTFLNYLGLSSTGVSIGYSGYKIKKINKKSGQQYWETTRVYKGGVKRKALSQPSFVDSVLTITLYDEATSTGSTWDECYPGQISLSLKDGHVLDSTLVDRLNPNLSIFPSIAGFFGQGSSINPKFYSTKNGYIQRSFAGWFNPNVNFGVIDNVLSLAGEIIKSDTFKLNSTYTLFDFFYFDNETDGINAIIASEEGNWKNKEIKFLKFDKDLTLIKSVDISQYFTDTIATFSLVHISNGYSIISTSYESPSLKTGQINFHLFDEAGNFVEKMIYTLRPETVSEIKYGWLYPTVDIVNKRILVTQSRQNKLNEGTFFEIYAKDGDTIQKVKRIEVEGIKDHFRTEYAMMMGNGDILLYVSQFAWTASPPSIAPDYPRYYSWIMLDGQKMNIVSNTKDDYTINNKLKLCPNPTSRFVTFQNLNKSANVRIFNLSGEIVKSFENITDQVNIEDLPNGMYIFDIRSKEINERHKIVKVE